MAVAAEKANYYPIEQVDRLQLVQVADVYNDTLANDQAGQEYELKQRSSDKFKGQVALEGLQAEYDAVTELAELTDGQMRTKLELRFDGHDLFGPDGRSLLETARRGLQAAREAAKKNPNLWFEVGRRSLELEEIRLTINMISQGEANTLMVISDFPRALESAKENIGGYNVARQQAIMRAITVNPDTGKILLISQTLDGSNPRALNSVDAEFGLQTIPEEERLGQPRQFKLSVEEQTTIMDRSVAAYDREMSAQFGGEWYAGRRPIDYRNTYDFVCQQHDLIDTYKNLKLSQQLTADIMYNLAATINARFEASRPKKVDTMSGLTDFQPVAVALNHNAYSAEQLYKEMMREGKKARAEGKSFSACGSTYTAEGLDELTEGLLKNAGYGERSNRSWHGGKRFKNKRCLSCEKVKAEVGACSICEDCVKNPKKGGQGTARARTSDPKKSKINKEPARIYHLDEYRKRKERDKNKAG